MFLSIIIATYNSEQTLKQTLDSIRYQSFKDFEVVIIDGASTDGTMKIVDEYKDIVTKAVSEKDSGIYNAFNKGLNIIVGEYVAFLGSDDCYCDYNVFSDLYSELKCGEVTLLSAPVYMVSEKDGRQRIISNQINREEILKGKMIPHQGVFVKTTIMKSYGFNEKYKIIADLDFLVRYLVDGGEIKYVNRFVVFYSDSGISSAKPGSKERIKIKCEQVDLLRSIGVKDPVNVSLFYYSFYLKEYVKLIMQKLKLDVVIRDLLGVTKKHHCELNYCRWCKRV